MILRKSVPAVKIAELIHPERIIIADASADKNQLLGRLVGLIARECPSMDTADVLTKVIARENGISTTLDTGLSIPHARIEGIENFLVAMALIPQGLIDKTQPGTAIKAMFLFLSPADSRFFQKHLQLLSGLSALFQPEFIDKLLACTSPAQVAAEIAAAR